jgi:hypothetical protein
MRTIQDIQKDLSEQDNYATHQPVYLCQIEETVIGVATEYTDKRCWVSNIYYDGYETYYDEFPEGEDIKLFEELGYKSYWNTVMFALTENGIKQYMEENMHNLERMSPTGKVRVYVDSSHRCAEINTIRTAISTLPINT